MKISSEKHLIDPLILKAQYEKGYVAALDFYVVHCIQEEKNFPKWVLDGLYKRSQKSIEDDTNKRHEKERYNSLIMAAVIAVKGSKRTSTEQEIFILAELLLSITNAQSKQGKSFSFENIKKTYGRIEKTFQQAGSNLQVMIHDNALEEFMAILDKLPRGFSIEKIQLQLQQMKKIHLHF